QHHDPDQLRVEAADETEGGEEGVADIAHRRLSSSRAPHAPLRGRGVVNGAAAHPSSTGSLRGPRTVPSDHLTTPSWSGRNAGTRASHSWSATRISMRARFDPTQR